MKGNDDDTSRNDHTSHSMSADAASVHAGRSSDTEVASLFDSCNSDDEDDASIEACGSQEYAQFVDETGRRQDLEQPQPIDNTATAAKPAADTLAAPAAEPPLPTKLPALTATEGLVFDLNQPWERSLLRQLEEAEKKECGYPRRELMLLGHTESRDFAMDYDQDDSMSVDTNASSTVPNRPQLIHRTILNMQPRVVYNLPVPDNTENERIVEMAIDRQQQPVVVAIVKRNPKKGYDSESSSLTGATMQTEEDRDETSFPIAKTIPDQLPGGQRSRQEQQDYYFLELEESVNGESNYNNNINNNLDGMTAAATLPDPGCFCLGYNMLDYVLPPPPPQGGMYLKKNSPRLGIRHSRLPRVKEEQTCLPEEVDFVNKNKKSFPTHRSSQRSAEPEGNYRPSRNDYYPSTTRQGVDF